MSEFQISIIVPALLALILGITANAFMVIIICITWARSRQLPSCDVLLLAQGVANIAIQCTSSMETLVAFTWPATYKRVSVQKLFFSISPICEFFSLSNTAWLCFFYCAKIANFSNVYFLYLKRRISLMVPWLVFGSLLSSVAIGVPVIWDIRKTFEDNSSATRVGEGPWTYEYSLYYKILGEGVLFSLPLMVMIPSAVIILISLCRHTQRMHQTSSGFSRGPSVEAHVGAAKTILSLLILYLCLHVAVLLMLSDIVKYKPALLWICVCIMCFYSFMHSSILILGNPMLKGAAAKILCYWRQ